VGDLAELRLQVGAGPLRGRVGGDQLRVLGLDGLQLGQQGIIFRIADHRIVQHEVAVVVVVDLGAQFGGAFGGGLGHGAHSHGSTGHRLWLYYTENRTDGL